MSLHVVNTILAPGKGSEISHQLLPMPHLPKPVCHLLCVQVLTSGKVGLKIGLQKLLSILHKCKQSRNLAHLYNEDANQHEADF